MTSEMICPLTIIDKSHPKCVCDSKCAALITVDNGKKAVCGLFANAVLPFEGYPARPVNWIDLEVHDVGYDTNILHLWRPCDGDWSRLDEKCRNTDGKSGAQGDGSSGVYALEAMETGTAGRAEM